MAIVSTLISKGYNEFLQFSFMEVNLFYKILISIIVYWSLYVSSQTVRFFFNAQTFLLIFIVKISLSVKIPRRYLPCFPMYHLWVTRLNLESK